MADITKCVGIGCHLRDDCYRYTAKDSEWQSYSNFTVYLLKGKCDMILPNAKARCVKQNNKRKTD